MTGEIITLIASILAALNSIFLLFIGSRLAIQRERRQLIWSKEIERFLKLEELAGWLIEELGSYRSIPNNQTELQSRLDALHHAGGKFSRYPEVRQAVRDLHNTLNRMLVAKRENGLDKARFELDPALQALLRACDEAIGRKYLT